LCFYAHELFQEARRCIGMEIDNLYAHERALVKVHSILYIFKVILVMIPTTVPHIMMSIKIVS
jgi:hypothetical protein